MSKSCGLNIPSFRFNALQWSLLTTASVGFKVACSQGTTSFLVSQRLCGEQISVAFRRITDMPDPMCVMLAEAAAHVSEGIFLHWVKIFVLFLFPAAKLSSSHYHGSLQIMRTFQGFENKERRPILKEWDVCIKASLFWKDIARSYMFNWGRRVLKAHNPNTPVHTNTHFPPLNPSSPRG